MESETKQFNLNRLRQLGQTLIRLISYKHVRKNQPRMMLNLRDLHQDE